MPPDKKLPNARIEYTISSNGQEQTVTLILTGDKAYTEIQGQAYELSPLVFLLVVNVTLLILGCFLEGTTIILVILPVLIPTAQALGIDLVQFGVICVVNIMIGLVTPPYGLLLFMMNKVADVPLGAMVREVMPFLYVMIGALALITLVPDFVLFLPRLLGYKG
jgi:TRAP-type C4-dicarboxylate transport system permease large subunit